jgi:geranylgeranyl diphosphate synthase type I
MRGMEDEMLDALMHKRLQIENYLETFFHKKKEEFGHINTLGEDLSSRLYSFSVGGKMIRGLFVYLGYALFRGDAEGTRDDQNLIQAGAAMELFQSALLVHDDIMDRDLKRRGRDSLFYQYSTLPGLQNNTDSYHIGESLGMCAGDVSFFLAFEILSRLKVRTDIYQSILALVSKELGYVGVAQMQDVFNGTDISSVSEDDILKLYLYKTGRYTFSLPLMIGALIADCDADTISTLEQLGESLGIIFQLKDDELGVYGSPSLIGKPSGSDIREGKKTLFNKYLREYASAEENRRLDTILGNPEISEEDIHFVKYVADRLEIRKLLAERIGKQVEKIHALVKTLPESNGEYRESLHDVIDFSLERAS